MFFDTFFSVFMGIFFGRGELSSLTVLEAVSTAIQSFPQMPLDCLATLLAVFLPLLVLGVLLYVLVTRVVVPATH